MTEATVIQQPQFGLSCYDENGSFSINATSFDGLFDQLAHRSAQLAAYAASRNALSAPEHTVGPELAKVAKSRKIKAEEAKPAEAEVDEGKAAAEAGGSTSSTASTDTAAPQDAPAATYEDVRNAVTSLAAAKGRDAAISVLGQFGVGHAKDLTEEQWAEAVGALTDAREAE